MHKNTAERQAKLVKHGSKAHAGQILSSLFRSIGNEKTELVSVKVPGKENVEKPRLVTKAEALVRDCFDKAMPASNRTGDNVKIEQKTQLAYRQLIFDRIGGKVGMEDSNDGNARNVADRVSELNREKLNRLAVKGQQIGEPSGKKPKKKTKPPKVPMCVRGQVEVRRGVQDEKSVSGQGE